MTKYSLAITLFLLRVPTVWYLVLTFMLAQMVLLYLQASPSFLYLNVVECMPSNPDDSLTLNEANGGLRPSSASSQSDITISDEKPEISGSNEVSDKSQASRPADLKISAKLESDTATVLASALNNTAEALKDYSPIISGTAVAAGAAVMTKSLPANHRLVGMTIAGSITSLTMLASQYLNLLFRNMNTTTEDNSSNINRNLIDDSYNSDTEQSFNVQETANITFIESYSDVEETGSPTTEPYSDVEDIGSPTTEPYSDVEDMGSPTTDSSFYIDAPLEGFDNLSMMTLAILMINLFIILGLLVILFNYLISQLKLESNKFVINKPLLLKFLKASERARDFNNKLVFVSILFGSCSMFYFLSYLLYFLKDLGL
jgi:hypothetical protein